MGYPAISVAHVTFSYDGQPPILRDVTLDVPSGARVILTGPSGSGKTTLLRLIHGLVRPSAGTVRVFGVDPMRVTPGTVGYIPQQLGLIRNRRALDNVLIGSLSRIPSWESLLGFFPADEVAQAEQLLRDIGLGAKMQEKVYRLSGGERQRVAIARTLLQRPRLILADEFVSDLDRETAADIVARMDALTAHAGVTLLMAT